ncbi:MAG: nucleoside-diphosphate kinase [Candidatus Blochmannia vicinus]|nr:MAG: nucleoside-diphosphate kinase [Candidatus Blochmannia vicinus]
MIFKEHTLSIIKPDAIAKNIIGSIISRFETAGLSVIEAKILTLTCIQASEFYCEHQKKYFFESLINFMISGPIFVQILSGNNSIQRSREIMGATNPKHALAGTIRSDYGYDCTKNAIHGSDSKKSAMREIHYFFNT